MNMQMHDSCIPRSADVLQRAAEHGRSLRTAIRWHNVKSSTARYKQIY